MVSSLLSKLKVSSTFDLFSLPLLRRNVLESLSLFLNDRSALFDLQLLSSTALSPRSVSVAFKSTSSSLQVRSQLQFELDSVPFARVPDVLYVRSSTGMGWFADNLCQYQASASFYSLDYELTVLFFLQGFKESLSFFQVFKMSSILRKWQRPRFSFTSD